MKFKRMNAIIVISLLKSCLGEVQSAEDSKNLGKRVVQLSSMEQSSSVLLMSSFGMLL